MCTIVWKWKQYICNIPNNMFGIYLEFILIFSSLKIRILKILERQLPEDFPDLWIRSFLCWRWHVIKDVRCEKQNTCIWDVCSTYLHFSLTELNKIHSRIFRLLMIYLFSSAQFSSGKQTRCSNIENQWSPLQTLCCLNDLK